MSFWEKFKSLIPLRHILFLVALFAVTIVIFQFDSAEDIQVTFEADSVVAQSSRHKLTIPYELIDSAELVPMPDGGQRITGTDNMVTRTGTWTNDTWGEYYVCADLDVANCIVCHLDDGRIFVFSRKNDAETKAIYETLLTYLPAA